MSKRSERIAAAGRGGRPKPGPSLEFWWIWAAAVLALIVILLLAHRARPVEGPAPVLRGIPLHLIFPDHREVGSTASRSLDPVLGGGLGSPPGASIALLHLIGRAQ